MKATTDADITYIERRESLDALGFEEYQNYVDSHLWFQNRQSLQRHPYYRSCTVCAALGHQREAHHLHHKNYRNLAKIEAFPDFIVPLCKYHHLQIHNMSADTKCSVEDATNTLLRAVGAAPCCPDAGREIWEWEDESLREALL